jgi:hypothetical protein
VLGDDLDTLGNEVGRVEADTELTNHGNISAGAESLYEALQYSSINDWSIETDVARTACPTWQLYQVC